MSAPALLGCPHCSKPISFAPELAGKVVACPHCRKQLQMPATPPGQAAPPPPSAAPNRRDKKAASPSTAQTEVGPQGRPDVDLSFTAIPDPQSALAPPADDSPRVESIWYRRTEFLATTTMWLGIVGSVAFAALIFHFNIMDMLRSGQPRVITAGVMFLSGVLMMLAAAVTAFMFLRAVAYVLVDGARNLRTLRQGLPPFK